MEFKILEQWNEKMDNSKELVIYGAGNFAKILMEYIKQDRFNFEKITAVVVTELGKENELCGIPIKKAEVLKCQANNEDLLVIVAVDENKQDEIIGYLKKIGIKNMVCMSRRLYVIFERLNNEYLSAQKLEWYGKEILAGMNLDRLIKESRWLDRTDFTPGTPAVNNEYLYYLYKILNSGKVKNILDIGLGQTSKMIAQYAKFDEDAYHIIIENDNDWIAFFKPELQESERSKIIKMDYQLIDYKGEIVRTYKDFKKNLRGYKFDFISIDAPLGADMENYSRIDILDILPECLETSWIIMLDNIERKGERNTYRMIIERLEENGIKLVSKQYRGVNEEFIIIASYDNRFFLTA